MRARHILSALVICTACARSSNAQESGRVGLTIAFPASVGIVWEATDNLAVRPDFAFSQASSDSLTSSSNAAGFGVSVLLYVRKWDALRAYVAPRFSYMRTSVASGSASPFSPKTNAYGGSGSFGAEYQLHRHFAVFAETGIGYTHSQTDGSTSIPGLSFDATTHTWGTRSGVGAIFWF